MGTHYSPGQTLSGADAGAPQSSTEHHLPRPSRPTGSPQDSPQGGTMLVRIVTEPSLLLLLFMQDRLQAAGCPL